MYSTAYPKFLSMSMAFALLITVSACAQGTSPEKADAPAATEVERISGADFLASYEPDAVVIDVRTAEEFGTGHLANALNIDVQSGDFQERIRELDPAKTYYLYCRSGNRSGRAGLIMRDLGFSDLYNIGGYTDLKAAGAEVVE